MQNASAFPREHNTPLRIDSLSSLPSHYRSRSLRTLSTPSGAVAPGAAFGNRAERTRRGVQPGWERRDSRPSVAGPLRCAAAAHSLTEGPPARREAAPGARPRAARHLQGGPSAAAPRRSPRCLSPPPPPARGGPAGTFQIADPLLSSPPGAPRPPAPDLLCQPRPLPPARRGVRGLPATWPGPAPRLTSTNSSIASPALRPADLGSAPRSPLPGGGRASAEDTRAPPPAATARPGPRLPPPPAAYFRGARDRFRAEGGAGAAQPRAGREGNVRPAGDGAHGARGEAAPPCGLEVAAPEPGAKRGPGALFYGNKPKF